jgi:DNA invertase Pin-like site-specific DNA recombinase
MKQIPNGLKRAALYLRVSTEEQAMHGVSLVAQNERLVQYSDENGLTIVDTYVDEGISARKRYTRRPAVLRLLEDVKQGKIDVILFIKLDRWFRNVGDYYEVQSILERHNVCWIATEEDYDTATANGRLSLNIKLAIAQDEADRTSERIKFVFKNMVRDGRVISGTVPKGYKIENKRPVVDEDMAEVVRDAYQKMADVRSMKKVQTYICDTYGIFWGLKEIKHILTNPWYIGEAYGVDGYCPKIIDKELWNLVGNIVEVRSARYDGTRTDRVYLFTGLMICGCCGHRMSTYSCANRSKEGKEKQRYIYYRCHAHMNRQCEMRTQVNQDILERWLVDNIALVAQEYNFSLTEEEQKREREKRAVDVQKARMKLERLKDLYLSNLILKDMYEKDYAALTALIFEGEQKEREERKPIDLTIFKNFKKTYWDLTMESRKALWSRVIERIIVTESGDYIVRINQL